MMTILGTFIVILLIVIILIGAGIALILAALFGIADIMIKTGNDNGSP
jgi:hypothetical protein